MPALVKVAGLCRLPPKQTDNVAGLGW